MRSKYQPLRRSLCLCSILSVITYINCYFRNLQYTDKRQDQASLQASSGLVDVFERAAKV